MSEKRQKLEAAARKRVQRAGLHGLSFRTLADEIGIKSSSVHYYFPEKSDLARVLIERYHEEFFTALHDIASKRWKLKRKLSAFIAIFEAVEARNELCLCGMLALEAEQLDADNIALLGKFFTETEAWLVSLFKEHKAELKTTIAPSVLAMSLLSGLEGALLVDRTLSSRARVKAQKSWIHSLLA